MDCGTAGKLVFVGRTVMCIEEYTILLQPIQKVASVPLFHSKTTTRPLIYSGLSPDMVWGPRRGAEPPRSRRTECEESTPSDRQNALAIMPFFGPFFKDFESERGNH